MKVSELIKQLLDCQMDADVGCTPYASNEEDEVAAARNVVEISDEDDVVVLFFDMSDSDPQSLDSPPEY